MRRELQGTLRTQTMPGESFRAFLPSPLPPKPELARGTNLEIALSRADQMLGRLDGISRILPSVELLLYFYTRKEAVLSSQIEGTQTTFSEYLLFELDAQNAPSPDDIVEVSNYVAAMNHGLARLKDGFPLSLRLIREIHEVLLRTGRGSSKGPGEFRTQQNWVGGTRPGNAKYVPPPAHEMNEALDKFEKFLHGEARDFPVLVQAALLHAQFETIHPFQDGNGRLGRLLVTLLLVERGVLTKPLLYMSVYLKQNRDAYFDHLQAVRMEGAWEEWIEFFLSGVCSTAERAVGLAHDMLLMFRSHEGLIQGLGPKRGSAMLVFHQLQRSPYLTPQGAAQFARISLPTSLAALKQLERLGLLRETTGRQRRRIYMYEPYLKLLNEGTDAPTGHD